MGARVFWKYFGGSKQKKCIVSQANGSRIISLSEASNYPPSIDHFVHPKLKETLRKGNLIKRSGESDTRLVPLSLGTFDLKGGGGSRYAIRRKFQGFQSFLENVEFRTLLAHFRFLPVTPEKKKRRIK